MGKVKLFGVILIIMLVFGSCANDDPDYKVEFTVNSKVYSFTGGYTDLDNPPEGSLYNDSDLIIKATPDGASDTSSHVLIGISEGSTGSYIETSSDIWFHAYNPDMEPDMSDTAAAQDLQIEITTLQRIGGEISGTFQGSVDQDGSTYDLTDGYFCVERIADNVWPPN